MEVSTPLRGPARVRFGLDDRLPDLLTQVQLLNLLRQKYGQAPSYVTFREMVEAGCIPSRWNPYSTTREFRNRRYNWAEVEAALDARSREERSLGIASRTSRSSSHSK